MKIGQGLKNFILFFKCCCYHCRLKKTTSHTSVAGNPEGSDEDPVGSPNQRQPNPDTDSQSGLGWFHSLEQQDSMEEMDPVPASTPPPPAEEVVQTNSTTEQPQPLHEEFPGNRGARHGEETSETPAVTNGKLKEQKNLQEEKRHRGKERMKRKECDRSGMSAEDATSGDPASVVQTVSKKLYGRRLQTLSSEMNQTTSSSSSSSLPKGGLHPQSTGGTVSNNTDLMDELDLLFSSDAQPAQSSTPVSGKRHIARRADSVHPSAQTAVEDPPGEGDISGEDLRSKFSGFTFKPRERIHNTDAPQKSETLSSAGKSSSGSLHALSKLKNEKSEKEKRDKGVRRQKEEGRREDADDDRIPKSPPDGSSSSDNRLRLRGLAEAANEKPSGRSHDLKEAGKGSGVTGETSGGAELKRQRLLQKLSSMTTGEDKAAAVRVPPASLPHTPSSHTPDQSRPKVASTTLAKLSRFSFIASPPSEEKTTKPAATASTVESPHTTISADNTNTVLPTAHKSSAISTTEKNATSSETSHTKQWCSTAKTAHTQSALINKTDNSTETVTEPQIHTLRDTNTKTSTGASGGDEPAPGDAGNPKKRKCFELGSGAGGKGLFSGLALFSSAGLEEDDSLLDLDWESEPSKRAKL